MSTRQYIGARYVPKFSEPIVWDKRRGYEALEIVTYLGTSYTSKKPVPAGTEIDNEEYWVVTGNYNAQVEQYRQETQEVIKNLTTLGSKVDFTYDYVVNLAFLGFSESNTASKNAEILREALRTSKCAIIYIPRGQYNISKVDIDFELQSIKICGCGHGDNGSCLNIETDYCFNITGKIRNVIFDNFAIMCKTGASGININTTEHANGVMLTNMFIHDATYGLTLTNVVYFKAIDCYINLGNDNVGYCVKVNGYEYNYFIRCHFQCNISSKNEKDLVIIDSTSYTWFNTCEFAKTTKSGILLISNASNCRRTNIDNCVFYRVKHGVHFDVYNKDNGETTIRGCMFLHDTNESYGIYGAKKGTSNCFGLIVNDCVANKALNYDGTSSMFYFDNDFLKEYTASLTNIGDSSSGNVIGNNTPNHINFTNKGCGKQTFNADGSNKIFNVIIGTNRFFPKLINRMPAILLSDNLPKRNTMTSTSAYYDDQDRLRVNVIYENAPGAGSFDIYWNIIV